MEAGALVSSVRMIVEHPREMQLNGIRMSTRVKYGSRSNAYVWMQNRMCTGGKFLPFRRVNNVIGERDYCSAATSGVSTGKHS